MEKEPGVDVSASHRRIAILAPHASAVPMDGGSIRSRAIADAFANIGYEVYFWGREEHLRITKNDGVCLRSKIPRNNSKILPALLSLVRQSHYVREKHMPEKWIAATCEALDRLRIGNVFLNFVWAEDVVRRLNYKPRVLLDTHNNEVEWFENLMTHRQGLPGRIVCRNSIRYSLRAIKNLDPATELIHVSERDRDFYTGKRPDLTHRILPNGCVVKPRRVIPDYTVPVKRLYFLGSLSTSMNQDALVMFAATFWPTLKDHATFTVIGSKPPQSLSVLCSKNSWTLVADPDDRALDLVLENMHYAILPFSYGAGSKLKLLDACGRGIPALATSGGVTGFSNLPEGVFVSEIAREWREKLMRNSSSQMIPDGLLEFAGLYSWNHLVSSFVTEAGL